MPEVEIFEFLHEIHMLPRKFKEREFEEKKFYYISLLSYVAFQK